MTYKLVKNIVTGQNDLVIRNLKDGKVETCLITDEEYLKWLEAGNKPLPADK
jgi:hypothetical protein